MDPASDHAADQPGVDKVLRPYYPGASLPFSPLGNVTMVKLRLTRMGAKVVGPEEAREKLQLKKRS